MKKARMIARVVIVIIAIIWNKQILDSRQEISTLELVKIAGLDYVFSENNNKENENSINNGELKQGESKIDYRFKEDVQSQISLVINSNTEGGTNSKNESGNNGGLTQIFSFKGLSYNTAVTKSQTYMEKSVPGSHIQYFVLGSEVLDYDIMKAIDFISRNNEVRLNAKVYTADNQSAKEFLTSAIQSTHKPDNKLSSMEETTEFQRQYIPLEVLDILESEKEKKSYMLPRLKLSQDGENVDKTVLNDDNELEEDENYFDFDGYTVAFNNKRVLDLNVEQSSIYNLLINKSKGIPIDISDGKNIISFSVIESKCKYEYKFTNSDGKTIPSKLIINIDFTSNIEEDDANVDLFDNNVIEKYQKVQEKVLKTKVQEVIQKQKESGVDFLKIEEKLKLKHPYKYRKVKTNFDEIIKNMNIEVKTNCTVKRTYDVVMTDTRREKQS